MTGATQFGLIVLVIGLAGTAAVLSNRLSARLRVPAMGPRFHSGNSPFCANASAGMRRWVAVQEPPQDGAIWERGSVGAGVREAYG